MDGRIRLIVRGDDFGLSHAHNIGIEKCVREGILTCVSLMACATEAVPPRPDHEWALGLGGGAEEALEICRRHPEFDVGAHLTLDRLRPLSPREEVPSLVDEEGYLWGWDAPESDQDAFIRHNPKPEEIEKEERAQIEKILNAGVELTYLDTHNRRAKATPAILDVLRRLSAEYRLPVSAFAGERPVSPVSVDHLPAREKMPAFIRILENLTPGLWLFHTHVIWPTKEMEHIAWWAGGTESVRSHCEAHMELFTSPKVKAIVEKQGIELVGYREIRDEFRERDACH